MIVVTQYECDYCHSRYSTEAKCEKCENSHVSVDSVVGYHYIPVTEGPECAYPVAVRVLMTDGQELVFKR